MRLLPIIDGHINRFSRPGIYHRMPYDLDLSGGGLSHGPVSASLGAGRSAAIVRRSAVVAPGNISAEINHEC